MKKKNLKKLLLAVCCAALLVCVSIGATVAYLTSAEKVVNTFTVGKVAITLDEAKVDVNGVVDEAATDRVKTNSYKLMPGHEYKKDPTVHVDAGSEACYVFVKVVNGINTIETTETGKTIAEQIIDNGWTALDDETGVYYKEWKPSDANDLVVFEKFIVSGEKDAAALEDLKTAKIEITAYAIQEDGFTTADAAWEQVKNVTVAEPSNP